MRPCSSLTGRFLIPPACEIAVLNGRRSDLLKWCPASGDPATGAFVAGPTLLSGNAATILSAPAGTGQGRWDFAADAPYLDKSLAVTIPGDASPGSYRVTLTFTIAPPVPQP